MRRRQIDTARTEVNEENGENIYSKHIQKNNTFILDNWDIIHLSGCLSGCLPSILKHTIFKIIMITQVEPDILVCFLKSNIYTIVYSTGLSQSAPSKPL